MSNILRSTGLRMALITSLLSGVAFVGTAAAQSTAQQPAKVHKHHSKLKGAMVGGAAGAVVGGKRGAEVGAVGGALWQHHRNRKARKAMKAQAH